MKPKHSILSMEFLDLVLSQLNRLHELVAMLDGGHEHLPHLCIQLKPECLLDSTLQSFLTWRHLVIPETQNDPL